MGKMRRASHFIELQIYMVETEKKRNNNDQRCSMSEQIALGATNQRA